MAIKRFDLSPNQADELDKVAQLYGYQVVGGALLNKRNQPVNTIRTNKIGRIHILSMKGDLIYGMASTEGLRKFLEQYYFAKPLQPSQSND